MSDRNKKIVGAVVAVLVILLLVVWLMSRSQPAPVTVVNEDEPRTPSQFPSGSLNTGGSSAISRPTLETTEPPEPEREPEEQAVVSNLRGLAMSFAERYGSFSNQGNFENLEDLRVFMTDRLLGETDDFIADARANPNVMVSYYGMTTGAISVTTERLDEARGTATVRVNTQRQEITSDGSRVFYQEIRLEMEREDDIWKVDSAEWLEEAERL